MEKDIRPWGQYEVLLDNSDCKVKIITVSPGHRLSYQYHDKRNERWIIVKGIATVTLDDNKFTKIVGDSIHIPVGVKHRVANDMEEDLVFIEVQTGTYFGEDDIVRIEDDYNRE